MENSRFPLPTELILEIFKFFPSSKLLVIRLVCKEFDYVFSQSKHEFRTFLSFFNSTKNENSDLFKPPTYHGDSSKEVYSQEQYKKGFGKDFSSIEKLVELAQRLKVNLQVQEMIPCLLWKLEKEHYLRSLGYDRKERLEKLDQLKRSQIPDGNQRLVFKSKNIQDEFRDLCKKIFVTKFKLEENYFCDYRVVSRGCVSATVLLGNEVKLAFCIVGEFKETDEIKVSFDVDVTFGDGEAEEIVRARDWYFEGMGGLDLSYIFLFDDRNGDLNNLYPKKNILEIFAERMTSECGVNYSLERMKRELELKNLGTKELEYFVLAISSVLKSWIDISKLRIINM